MKFSWRECAAGICAVLGTISWIYLGAYRMWKGPLSKIFEAHKLGNITLGFWIQDFLEAFMLLTVAGFIWCIWYILRGYFKGRKE